MADQEMTDRVEEIKARRTNRVGLAPTLVALPRADVDYLLEMVGLADRLAKAVPPMFDPRSYEPVDDLQGALTAYLAKREGKTDLPAPSYDPGTPNDDFELRVK